MIYFFGFSAIYCLFHYFMSKMSKSVLLELKLGLGIVVSAAVVNSILLPFEVIVVV